MTKPLYFGFKCQCGEMYSDRHDDPDAPTMCEACRADEPAIAAARRAAMQNAPLLLVDVGLQWTVDDISRMKSGSSSTAFVPNRIDATPPPPETARLTMAALNFIPQIYAPTPDDEAEFKAAKAAIEKMNRRPRQFSPWRWCPSQCRHPRRTEQAAQICQLTAERDRWKAEAERFTALAMQAEAYRLEAERLEQKLQSTELALDSIVQSDKQTIAALQAQIADATRPEPAAANPLHRAMGVRRALAVGLVTERG